MLSTMEQSPRNSKRPSAIPRLSKLSESKSSFLRPSPSKEALNPLRSSAVNNPRLRQSVSRDQLSLPSSNQSPSTPRIVSANLTSRKISDSPVYLSTPCSKRMNHDVISPNLLTSTTQIRADIFENLNSTKTKDLVAVKYDSSPSPQTSLSGRAVETLQNVSPLLRKKDPNFFNCDSDSRPNSRAASMNSGLKSIPFETSRGFDQKLQVPPPFDQESISMTPPLTNKSLKNFSASPSTGSNSSISRHPTAKIDKSPVNSIKFGSKAVARRPIEPKPPVRSLLKKPSITALQQHVEAKSKVITKKKSHTLSPASPNGTVFSINSSSSRATSASSVSGTEESVRHKSSMALRDQIAKAKATKRAATLKAAEELIGDIPVIPTGSFDFGLHSDPFNQNLESNNAKALLTKRIHSAQMDGRLNISSMRLKEIPEEVLNMYDLQYMKDISWAEVVDLTRLNAADNEFEVLSDDAFPDKDLSKVDEKDDYEEYKKGSNFFSLEIIDLRGNKLTKLPLGFRRLELLTTLNISGNKLTNECFNIISQISSLRDLTLDRNKFSGELDPRLSNLRNLVVLNLRHNNISTLPDSLVELGQLRMLNVSENQLKSLPFNILSKLPLTEIIAAKNNLNNNLITEDVGELLYLQTLDVTCNSLTSLHPSANIKLPALQKLFCSSNRLNSLPNMTSWLSLITIDAEDNCIESLPQDLIMLPEIRSVNLNGNQIRTLDNRLGQMETLDILRISGNPLREKRFAGMSTYDLKQALLARLEPESENEKDIETDQVFFTANESLPPDSPTLSNSGASVSSTNWVVQCASVLDRSNTQSHTLNPVATAEIAAAHKIKTLSLHHNNFRVIPESVAFFMATLTTLNLSHNEITSDTYLVDNLELPELKELNLSSNTLDSLQPLCQRLQAPKLERLDVSFNRLSSLPILRNHFPELITLLASHNIIRELLPESVQGLQVLDCSSNEINSLNAKIGLLGGSKGLKNLDVRGNRFKVPKYTILEKGTEATLSWLKDRIPASELVGSDCEKPTD